MRSGRNAAGRAADGPSRRHLCFRSVAEAALHSAQQEMSISDNRADRVRQEVRHEKIKRPVQTWFFPKKFEIITINADEIMT